MKNSVKSGTPLFSYLNDLLIGATGENYEEFTLENGLTIAETNKSSALLTEELYHHASKNESQCITRTIVQAVLTNS